MRLETSLFKTIVENTPLLSIDLIVTNNEGKVLLGQRQNRPAQHFWFVPGGRIFKDEPFNDAFKRISREELGLEVSLDKTDFLGIYEHFYEDNFSGTDFTTHYIVHGYKLVLGTEDIKFPLIQHNFYKWFDEKSLISNSSVHLYTKNYFLPR